METGRMKVGKLGEEIAATFLVKRGHRIVHMNYRKPWGEIDVISEHAGTIHFVEVKTGRATFADVSRGTSRSPLENIDPRKLKRLHRTVETYILQFHVKQEYQIDAIQVLLDERRKEARVTIIENIH